MVRFSLTLASLVVAVGACSSSITPMRPRPPIPAPEPQQPQPLPEPPVVQLPPLSPVPIPPPPLLPPPRNERADQPVRVALALNQDIVRLSAIGGAWALYDRTGEYLVAQAGGGDEFTIEQREGELRITGSSGAVSSIRGPLIARAEEFTLLTFNGKRYRGEMLVLGPANGSANGLTVVNRLSMETYLRGVVPLEIGTNRTEQEIAAVAAQAVAARSYTYKRLDDSRPYDLGATVMDQVYGGADAERPVADVAIEETRGLVLWYNGKIVNAPYHSNSGGATAAASEVWRSKDEPHLVSVSDRIPGSDRFYCEDSPKFRWSRTFDADALAAVLSRYLSQYSNAPRGSVGHVLNVSESGRTRSGRVAALIFETEKGTYTVRGNDIRFVLRSSGGEILPSTLFSLDTERRSGRVTQVTIEGTGNGHGVGMDQWGAIGRARAGQDYATILRTYYPGTTLGPAL